MVCAWPAAPALTPTAHRPLLPSFLQGAKEAIDPNKQYIFAVHPHGIHCWPLNIFAFVTSAFYEAFPGMQIAGVAATVMVVRCCCR